MNSKSVSSTPKAPPKGQPFRHVGVVGKYQAVGSKDAIESITQFLHSQGCEVSLEHDTALNTGLSNHPVLDVNGLGQHCDLALVMGGDGTMLGIARQLASYGVPLVGINQGRLGFITDIPFSHYQELLGPVLQGHYQQDLRTLMQASIWRDGRCIFEAIAMNDVVVNRSGSPSMIELRVEVDGHFMANQRADGLIIASPTGSTAYALSAGGPLLHPGIEAWVMAPIAPHTLSNRPIVLPSSSEIVMEVVNARDASAHFDMQSFTSLMHGDRISVRRAAHDLRLLHPVGWSYFDTLRRKLHWNEGVIS